MQKNATYILSFIAFVFTILISYQNSLAQQVRWCYSSTNIRNVVGVPNSGLKAGPSKYAGEPKIEDPAAEIKSPIEVHLKYKALDSVRQIIIIENNNPGCVAKIEIGNKSLNKRQTVYEGVAEKTEVNFRINNILFDVITYPVTDLWLSCEPDKVPGNNQIDAVGISSLSENYIPQINLPLQPFFEGEATQLKMEYVKQNHRYSASTPVVNTDETQLFFSSNIANMFHNEELFEVNMQNDTDKIYQRSEYNFPLELSTATGIIAAFDNELVLSNMSFPKPTFYIAKRNEKNKIDYFPFTIHNYKNDRGAHQYEIMSNDKKVMIIAQTRDANNELKNKQDMYVCFREQDGNYSSPVYMGDVLNTNGNEVPSYINKTADTLYFSSDGHLGFGNRDIFYSVRADSTFLNWTEPKNLGNILNSEDKEIYFTISPTKKIAYFTRNGKIMQLKIADPYKAIAAKKEVIVKDTMPAVIIKPSEIILVKGFVLNKTNDNPVEADISVFNLTTNEKVLFSKSDSISGEYDLILTSGYNYSINAVAEDFIAVSENVDLTNITESTEIEKNLYLVPFLVGQTVRLNNIFFETAKWDLLPESNQELDKLFIFLKNNSTIIIEIAGHTDNQGDDGSNKILSENRAKAVMDYLLLKGVEKNRISSVGFGETKPETTNETDEGRMRNRRVEFKIIAQ